MPTINVVVGPNTLFEETLFLKRPKCGIDRSVLDVADKALQGWSSSC